MKRVAMKPETIERRAVNRASELKQRALDSRLRLLFLVNRDGHESIWQGLLAEHDERHNEQS